MRCLALVSVTRHNLPLQGYKLTLPQELANEGLVDDGCRMSRFELFLFALILGKYLIGM